MSPSDNAMGFGATFEVPEEELWIKEIKIDTPEVLNEFFKEAATREDIKDIHIHECTGFGYVLISFERNINYKEEETTNEPQS